MKIYAIANECLETWGHGHNVEELRICKQGMDQGGKGGEFPPVFKTRQAAQDYLDSIKYNSEMKIVELILID